MLQPPNSTKIIDTVSGNHANLTIASVDKWQPVMLKDVFTIGAVGRDYPTAFSYEAAVVNNSNHKIGYVYGDTSETVTIVIEDQLGIFELVAAKGQEADFTGGGASLGFADIWTSRCDPVIKNLNIHARIRISAFTNTSKILIEGCHIDRGVTSGSTAQYGIMWDANANGSIIKNCMISKCGYGIFGDINGNTVKIINSIAINNDINFVDGICINCVSVNGSNTRTNGDFWGNITSLNSFSNISSDATATTLGIGTQDANLNTYFTDPATNDYTINTAGQAAFAGQGWNGTDIVSWAYTVSTGQIITLTSGSYSYSGTSLSLLNNSLVNVNSGNYSLTGQALALVKGTNLLANNGTYTLIGTQNSLLTAKNILTGNGVFNLTGTGLTLTYNALGQSITIDSGVITLFGTSNSLLTQNKTTIDNGSYILTGTDKQLLANFIVNTNSGIYALLGQNINLLANYDIIASSINYNLTGYNLTLRYSGDVIQNIGSVGATFKNSGVGIGYKTGAVTVNFKQDLTVNFKG